MNQREWKRRAHVVAIATLAVCAGSSWAAATPLADGERNAPKAPRDGAAPKAPGDGKKPAGDAGTPDEPDKPDPPPDDKEPDDKEPDGGKPKEPDGGEEQPKNPECVHVRTEARYVAYGYNHIVEIENACEKTMRCTVMTDVNPQPSVISVEPTQTRSIITFRGSPSREFNATVLCDEEGAGDTE
jgi:hypothetical protein